MAATFKYRLGLSELTTKKDRLLNCLLAEFVGKCRHYCLASPPAPLGCVAACVDAVVDRVAPCVDAVVDRVAACVDLDVDRVRPYDGGIDRNER